LWFSLRFFLFSFNYFSFINCRFDHCEIIISHYFFSTHREHLIIEKRTSLAWITDISRHEDVMFELIATSYHVNVTFNTKTIVSQQVITLTWHFDSETNIWHKNEQTENTVSVINKRTLSKTRRASYQNTSRTSCFDERRIETHRKHSIIKKRTSLTSITEIFRHENVMFELIATSYHVNVMFNTKTNVSQQVITFTWHFDSETNIWRKNE
jgi:hypothetical protein